MSTSQAKNRLLVCEIGTNSVKFTLYGPRCEKLEFWKCPVERVPWEGIRELAETAEEVVCVCTEICRKGFRPPEFLKQLGCEVRVLTPEEEARYAFISAGGDGNSLVVDVGGGSAEMAYLREGKMRCVSVEAGEPFPPVEREFERVLLLGGTARAVFEFIKENPVEKDRFVSTVERLYENRTVLRDDVPPANFLKPLKTLLSLKNFCFKRISYLAETLGAAICKERFGSAGSLDV